MAVVNHYGEIFNDARRAVICQPGHLVYSAKVDQGKLECYLCCAYCMLCAKTQAAQRSYLDVYTNGILTNTPYGGCCAFQDRGFFFHYDDIRVGKSGQAGCCKPFPYMCPHGCGCCGDVFYTYRCCVFGFCPFPLGWGHSWLFCPFGFFSCFLTDLFCGLKEGEAATLSEIIERTRAGQALPLPRPTPWAQQVAQAQVMMVAAPQPVPLAKA